jgi:hypothetical protein
MKARFVIEVEIPTSEDVWWHFDAISETLASLLDESGVPCLQKASIMEYHEWQKDEQRKAWNIAADMAVNQILQESGIEPCPMTARELEAFQNLPDNSKK